MNARVDTEQILDAFLAPEADRLPDRVIDAALADIARTPQRRAMRGPWRFLTMPAVSRAAGIAAVTIVAVVGVGSIIYFNSTGAGGPRPTSSPTPSPAEVAPGITGWTTYTSATYPVQTVGYPADWSVRAPATRQWQVGDDFPADELPYADTFVSPGEGDAQIGLLVWEMPAGDGADIESLQGLRAWAETFCNDIGESSCEEFAQQAVPMCLNAGGDTCRSAILVPTADLQYAFFVNFAYAMFSDNRVRVVVVAREDGFPAAARYGGSVELLKSILSTMDVWTPGRQPRS